MKRLRLRIRQGIGEIPYRWGRARPEPPTFSVLLYHAVTRENLADPDQQTVSIQRFSEQMETLQESGIRCVSLEEGLRLLKEGSPHPSWASVVFDDGHVGVHDLAGAVLVRYRIPATLFAATERIGTPAFPGVPAHWGRPLTWAELQALQRDAQCVIGSHGHTHRALTRLTPQEARRELQTSRDEIENHLGRPCRLFAYPYGAAGTFSPLTEQLLREEGFTVGCTAVWGRARSGVHPLRIPRMRVSWCDSPRELQKSLAGCYDWYRLFQV